MAAGEVRCDAVVGHALGHDHAELDDLPPEDLHFGGVLHHPRELAELDELGRLGRAVARRHERRRHRHSQLLGLHPRVDVRVQIGVQRVQRRASARRDQIARRAGEDLHVVGVAVAVDLVAPRAVKALEEPAVPVVDEQAVDGRREPVLAQDLERQVRSRVVDDAPRVAAQVAGLHGEVRRHRVSPGLPVQQADRHDPGAVVRGVLGFVATPERQQPAQVVARDRHVRREVVQDHPRAEPDLMVIRVRAQVQQRVPGLALVGLRVVLGEVARDDPAQERQQNCGAGRIVLAAVAPVVIRDDRVAPEHELVGEVARRQDHQDVVLGLADVRVASEEAHEPCAAPVVRSGHRW